MDSAPGTRPDFPAPSTAAPPVGSALPVESAPPVDVSALLVGDLLVRDLVARDLPGCAWAGTATHMRHVEQELARVGAGEVDYLAVCDPAGLPVAIGGVDYLVSEGAGTLWQLAVHPALQSRGLGTRLIGAAEQKIRSRGLGRAELAVEEDNPRARALYERLGYVAYGREPDSWDAEQPDGSVRRYETMCVLLRKDLEAPGRATADRRSHTWMTGDTKE